MLTKSFRLGCKISLIGHKHNLVDEYQNTQQVQKINPRSKFLTHVQNYVPKNWIYRTGYIISCPITKLSTYLPSLLSHLKVCLHATLIFVVRHNLWNRSLSVGVVWHNFGLWCRWQNFVLHNTKFVFRKCKYPLREKPTSASQWTFASLSLSISASSKDKFKGSQVIQKVWLILLFRVLAKKMSVGWHSRPRTRCLALHQCDQGPMLWF
jgi:hypothetical protein